MGHDQRKKNAIPTMVAGRKTVYGPHSGPMVGNPETIPKRVRGHPSATSVLEHHFLEADFGPASQNWQLSAKREQAAALHLLAGMAWHFQWLSRQHQGRRI
jgi:hypothetical protein